MRGTVPPFSHTSSRRGAISLPLSDWSLQLELGNFVFIRTLAHHILEPFEKFVDWRQCAAVMQREAVTYAKL
jgi:hypothetical protein